MFLITIGGLVIDVIVILSCISLWNYTFLRLGLALILLSQGAAILRNLIPISSVYAGVSVPSDGKIILKLLAGS